VEDDNPLKRLYVSHKMILFYYSMPRKIGTEGGRKEGRKEGREGGRKGAIDRIISPVAFTSPH